MSKLSLKFVDFNSYLSLYDACRGEWRIDLTPSPTDHYFTLNTSYVRSSRKLYVWILEHYGQCCEEGAIANEIGETVFNDMNIEDVRKLTPRLQEWAKEALIVAMLYYKNKIDTFLEAAGNEPEVTDESDLPSDNGYDINDVLEYHAQGIRNLAERLSRSVESGKKNYVLFSDF